ncbi:MAG TPA: alpha/beta fold hydrolase [Bacteroidota bacterium]|nr:alpha/beta fold hydrolase [Bacteroidota bacterium]
MKNEITTRLVYTHFVSRIKPAASVADADALAPVLILLHGRGTDEHDLEGLVQFLDPRFECYSLRAPFDFEYGGYTWFTLDAAGGTYDKKELDEALESVIDFVKQVSVAQGRQRKVFLFGFSMGAMMAMAASLTHPELITGVVAHSGLVPEQADHLGIEWNALSHCGFFIAHGTYDPVVPVAYGRRADELLKKSNAAFVYKEYPIEHEISQESLSDAASWLSEKI